MSSLLLLRLSCKQNDKIGVFGRYQNVATGWFRKKRAYCQSEAKRGSREILKGPGCVLGWRQGSKGANSEALHTTTPVHQMGVCSELHEGHVGQNETCPWLVLISLNEGNHHKRHLAFWSGGRCGRTDESPTSAFNRALLLTVTQSRTLNCTLGFHADTEGTRHG